MDKHRPHHQLDQAVANAESYSGPELAALLVTLMLNTDANGQAYKSFADQIQSSFSIGNTTYDDSLRGILAFYQVSPHVFDAAHYAIRSLLLELEASNLWGNCKFVSRDHIRAVSNL